VDEVNGWVVGGKGLILRTLDAGNRWKVQKNGIDEDLWSVSFVDSAHGWAVGSGGTILRFKK
jgi:photosystem II stability/assembly factor-like uncharacterized protein